MAIRMTKWLMFISIFTWLPKVIRVCLPHFFVQTVWKPKPIAPCSHMRQLHVFSWSFNCLLGCVRLFSISQSDTLVPCRPICSLRYIWRELNKDWSRDSPWFFLRQEKAEFTLLKKIREFKKTKVATATGTLLNKNFNEQNNSCARAL